MHYLRGLTSPHRTDIGNRRLGRSLAFGMTGAPPRYEPYRLY
jgi:hypothetical protein